VVQHIRAIRPLPAYTLAPLGKRLFGRDELFTDRSDMFVISFPRSSRYHGLMSSTTVEQINWRRHQSEALAALAEATSRGCKRSWVSLPPGAGKTAVGCAWALKTGRKTVVFSPNIAIQRQWVSTWQRWFSSSDVSKPLSSRDLSGAFNSLTYQALAVFDADAHEGDGPDQLLSGTSPQPRHLTTQEQSDLLLTSLHPNGQALVKALAEAGPLAIILDECHHLLQVWGELLVAILRRLDDVVVLGLTATPPEQMTEAEAALVQELFGGICYSASIPALVREGDLVPFAELAWLTTPTTQETDWLTSEAEHFTQFLTDLMDPEFGSTSLLSWLDLRFVQGPDGAPPGMVWEEVVRSTPALADAVLRVHSAGLCELPLGAVVRQQTRCAPTVDDWMLLVDDWLRNCLKPSDSPADAEVMKQLGATMGSVGYRLTRGGIRRDAAPADRVLARSDAKAEAAAVIAQQTIAADPSARILVLCDFTAAAALPTTLENIMVPESGSAAYALEALLDASLELCPLLVTGTVLGGNQEALIALIASVRSYDDRLAGRAQVVEFDGATWSQIIGWTSDDWVPAVTRFLAEGGTQVLVGTRALLGEGWDARPISTVIDLTSATTTASIVQTRGRALRTDPANPDKVATTWTVACVTDRHPLGDHDWRRLVRKQAGWFAVDEYGDVIDGVAHCDANFDPSSPPSPAEFDAINTKALIRSQNYRQIREAWAALGPAPTEPVATLDVRSARQFGHELPDSVAALIYRRNLRPGIIARAFQARWVVTVWLLLLGLAVVSRGALPTHVSLVTEVSVATGVVALLGVVLGARRGWRLLRSFPTPSLGQLASAVAQALHDTGQIRPTAADVLVTVRADGSYQASLQGANAAESQVFALSLDEVIEPLDCPRYLIRRGEITHGQSNVFRAARAGLLAVVPDVEIWHAVPAALGDRRDHADAFGKAWAIWVGGDPHPVFAASPEGTGILAANRGSDPFGLASGARALVRRRW